VIKQSEIEIIVSLAVERTIIAISFKENENFLTDLEADLREMLRDELTKAGVAVQQKRRARVSPAHHITLESIRSYLPHNFTAHESSGTIHGDAILIEGYDRAGWTLDGYVIPRLGSGLIFAKEVSL
jgi:hypothetical protein